MNTIRIVSYESHLAAAVAEMWNRSKDGWGSRNSVRTEEQVLQQEANSSNLHLFIAMDGDQAVGYCSLSEYREDEGALYIPLLNVRGDYQGKKIGKMLVLKALEKTIELGWPRLDLYTWPGNTKAVPLYKKCGFFWEESDESTHLMNFIPSILATDAIKDYFADIDWYNDSSRMIEVKPDGRKENGFEFFEYSWLKGDNRLRVELERKGRGIRLIETDDYLLSASVDKFKLVFGDSYPIRYDVINKSGKPLDVSFQGVDDKNIRFDFAHEVSVSDRASVEGTFYVDVISEEQNSRRTHPTVTTQIEINGKVATFKVGIAPQFPAKVSVTVPGSQSYTGVPSEFYLDMENSFEEPVEFSFELPSADFIRFGSNQVNVKLNANEKRSIPLRYELIDFGMYSPQLSIQAKKDNGHTITFEKKIAAAFKGLGVKMSGECDDYWRMYNGIYHVWLKKFNNVLFPGKTTTEDQNSLIYYPKLGKPYSGEFSKKRPSSVRFYEEKGAMCLEAIYASGEFPQLELVCKVKLYAEGLVEHKFEVKNLSDLSTEEMWLNQGLYHNLTEAVIPTEGTVVDLKDSIGAKYEYWDSRKIDENWLFSRLNGEPRGICWAAGEPVHFENWYLFFEHGLGVLPPNGTAETKPIYLSIGAYTTWDEFRSFALKQQVRNEVTTADHFEFYLEEHNPFVKGDFGKVHLKERKMSYLDGSIHVGRQGESAWLDEVTVNSSEELREKDFLVPLEANSPVQVLNLKAKLQTLELDRQTLALKTGDQPIRLVETVENGYRTLIADNGLIQIKSAPDFFPSIYSLTSHGEEWLDTSYPKIAPKSWWNPWPGGVYSALSGMSTNSMSKPSCNAEFVTLHDNRFNEWQGIKITVNFTDHEKYKGLSYRQYFLMMPGVPLVCQTTEIIQNTGSYMHMKRWFIDGFFPLKEGEHSGRIQTMNPDGYLQTFHVGNGEVEAYPKSSIALSYEHRKEMLQVITADSLKKNELYANKEIVVFGMFSDLNLEHGQRMITAPYFMLLTDQFIPDGALNDLKNIRF
jgi:ribosomal protein S18 acetylase RimI-like enzyme